MLPSEAHQSVLHVVLGAKLTDVLSLRQTVFPEMRAQLRTYHAIPSLQARQDPHAYKQLQDAPRLKSILKGSMEDRQEPDSLMAIKEANIPRTNPVSLLFVICSSAQKIAELHFPHGQEFHDLVMKTNFTSRSRASAFLWLMWFYLESDFTEEGCEENPFGPGVDYGLHVANQGVPRLEAMTTEEEEQENVDTVEEREFGKEKQKMRARILEADQAYLADSQTKRGSRRSLLADDGPAILPRIRPSKHDSDLDSPRSTPPPSRIMARQAAIGSASRRAPGLKYHGHDASSPATPSQGDGVVARKPRPPTAHQLAVERHRKEQVYHILDRGLRRKQHRARKSRRQDGAIYRAMRRVQAMSDELAFQDSDDEIENSRDPTDGDDFPFRIRGPGGLCQLKREPDDFGEETSTYYAAIRRAVRRLNRWTERTDRIVVPPIKRKKSQPDESTERQEGDEHEGNINNSAKDREANDINGHVAGGKAASKKDKSAKANGDGSGDVEMKDAGDVGEAQSSPIKVASARPTRADDDEEQDSVMEDVKVPGKRESRVEGQATNAD